MSDDLYSTRLRWCNGRGMAKLHGKPVPLSTPPVLAGYAVAEIDYIPEVRCYEIRRAPHDRMEELRGDEIAAADALLRELVGEVPA